MANNKMTGIIFSNSHDDALGGLTARRSMGSVPFASRYRLIDLAILSRMSHAGVDSVALVMQNNYHSLMEHIGSGKVGSFPQAGRHCLFPALFLRRQRRLQPRYAGIDDQPFWAICKLQRRLHRCFGLRCHLRCRSFRCPGVSHCA